MVYDSYSNYLYAAIGAAIVQLDPVTLLEKSRLDLTGYFMMNRLLTDNAEQDWFVAYIQN